MKTRNEANPSEKTTAPAQRAHLESLLFSGAKTGRALMPIKFPEGMGE